MSDFNSDTSGGGGYESSSQQTGGASYTPEATPSNYANTNQQAQQATGTQSTPVYVTPDDLNNSYRSIQSTLTKQQENFNNQLSGINSTVAALQPLAQLLQQQQQTQTVDPYINDPLGSLRTIAQKLEIIEQANQQYEQKLQALEAERIGTSHAQAINEHFSSHPAFSGPAGKDNFERTKALAGTVHKEQFAHLYQMNGGNAVAAFDHYVELLQAGKLGNSPEINDLNNRFKQNQINSQKARMAALGNPQAGYNPTPSARATIYDMGGLSF